MNTWSQVMLKIMEISKILNRYTLIIDGCISCVETQERFKHSNHLRKKDNDTKRDWKNSSDLEKTVKDSPDCESRTEPFSIPATPAAKKRGFFTKKFFDFVKKIYVLTPILFALYFRNFQNIDAFTRTFFISMLVLYCLCIMHRWFKVLMELFFPLYATVSLFQAAPALIDMVLDAISDDGYFHDNEGYPILSTKTSGRYLCEFICDIFSGQYEYCFKGCKSLHEVFRKIIEDPGLLKDFNPFFLFCVKMSLVSLFFVSFYYVRRNFDIRRNPIIHYISLGIISCYFVHSGAFIAFLKNCDDMNWLFDFPLFWPLKKILFFKIFEDSLNKICFVALFYILYHIYNCLMTFFESENYSSNRKRAETRNEKEEVE